jgi:predicted DNA-binding ArsR family transcriptional regulator
MNVLDEVRNCKVHGNTLFRFKSHKKGQWYVCDICLKAQWRKATKKQLKKPGKKEYHQQYTKELYLIRKSLSVYLVMILLAAKIKPE